jgi:hypothetical protein
MNRYRISLFTLITLVSLVITPAIAAEIYKCDGPDGPIYSDKKCGPDAANVEVLESSGMSGVSEQDKADLAEKKKEREQEQELAREQAQNQKGSEVNNQNNVYTEDPGYWGRDGDRLRNLDKANILPGKTPPTATPTEPRPVTLPANMPKKRKDG